MMRINNTQVLGWEHAISGMRNPMNSWEKSDSGRNMLGSPIYCDDLSSGQRTVIFPECDKTYIEVSDGYFVGPNDLDLMRRLASNGPVHAKYRRMISVYADILAPLYWWKEFDTYKVGTVANSCSTMHKIHAKEFTIDDFSCEHIVDFGAEHEAFNLIVNILNYNRKRFLETGDKLYWWQMIQLLPTSYNQLRTVMLNYEVLTNIYPNRKNHKLDEWRFFCRWIEELPLSELITGVKAEKTDTDE